MAQDSVATNVPDPQHALYPGSFDIVTFGHLDMLDKALKIFKRVTIAIAQNHSKTHPFFTIKEREQMLRDATAKMGPCIEVSSFSGLTVNYARSIGAGVIVRGLRAMSDFDTELQMAMVNEQLAPDIVQIFLAAAPKHIFLSSSLVKELAVHGADLSPYVLPCIEKRIKERLTELNVGA